MRDMTREEILNMPAGREMNIKVIEDVMGWQHVHTGDFAYTYINPKYGAAINWSPSTDIDSAFELIDADKEFYLEFSNGKWYAMFGNDLDDGVFAETAPLAICRAALVFKMEKHA